MNYTMLFSELGRNLGLQLEFSAQGTCGVFFEDDEIDFEIFDGRLYIISELGDATGREDAFKRMLEANYLCTQTGKASLGLDSVRNSFTLCRVLEGEMDYQTFIKHLTVFVQAVRYWKKWLGKPPATNSRSVRQFGGLLA